MDTHSVFAHPVNVGVHKNYLKLIKVPMDFGTVRVRVRFLESTFLSAGSTAHDMSECVLNHPL